MQAASNSITTQAIAATQEGFSEEQVQQILKAVERLLSSGPQENTLVEYQKFIFQAQSLFFLDEINGNHIEEYIINNSMCMTGLYDFFDTLRNIGA